MKALRQTPQAGEYWTMNASKDLERRLAEVIRQRGIRPATDAEMKAKDEEIRREQRAHKVGILLGRLDARYRNSKTRYPESQEWLKGFRAGERRNLCIFGDPGTGKTWEASAIARQLLTEDVVPVTFTGAHTLMEALKPNSDGMSDISQFAVAPVLVLDDLGAERLTEWTEAQMFLLADERNVRMLPTIITTNLTGPQLRARYGDRIIDRFAQDSRVLHTESRQFRNATF